MPVRLPAAMAEDEFLPRHRPSSMRRQRLRDSKSTNFLPLCPSPLTTRPFSGAFDDQEPLSHVPVPLDPVRGLAAPRTERRRTPQAIQMLVPDPHFMGEARRPRTAPSAVSTTSHDSNETPSSLTHSLSASLSGRSCEARQCDLTLDWSEDSLQSVGGGRPNLSTSSSLADLRKKAAMIMQKKPSEPEPIIHLQNSEARSVEDDNHRGRRRSITRFILDMFRPKLKRDKSLNIEVIRTTKVVAVTRR